MIMIYYLVGNSLQDICGLTGVRENFIRNLRLKLINECRRRKNGLKINRTTN
jgi:hypothetical protein